MPTTRRGADTSEAPDPLPSAEMAAASARLGVLEDKYDELSKTVSEFRKQLQELSARPTPSPLEAFAGIKQGDVLYGSSSLLRRLLDAPPEPDPLATQDSAVRAMRTFEPSATFKAHVSKPLAAPAIADILLELEAWSVGHDGHLPFHLIRFLSGWSHSLTQISEMAVPTMSLKTPAEAVAVLFHYLKTNGPSLASTLSDFQAPPQLFVAAAAAKIENYIYELTACLRLLGNKLELVNREDRESDTANYTIFRRVAAFIPPQLYHEIQSGGFTFTPGSQSMRFGTFRSLTAQITKTLQEKQRSAPGGVKTLLAFPARDSAPPRSPAPAPAPTAAPPTGPPRPQRRHSSVTFERASTPPSSPTAPSSTPAHVRNDYKCYNCGTIGKHLRHHCPDPCRLGATCTYKRCPVHDPRKL